MTQKCQQSVAQQVERGFVPGDQQQLAHTDQFLFAQFIITSARRDQSADQVVLWIGAALLDQSPQITDQQLPRLLAFFLRIRSLTDTDVPARQGVQGYDRYAYSNNNPVRYTDPTGHWIESAVDIAFIAYDIYDISQNGLNWENGLALAADVAGLALPVVTGGGAAVRALMHADDVVKAVNTADNVIDTAKAIDNAVDAGNAADNLLDGFKTAGDIPCSFSAETDVATLDGAKDIAAIELGDYVLAWNEADGTVGYYEVTAVMSHADEVLVELILDGEWIETTPENPFYVKGKGWMPAEDLRLGDEIRQADGATHNTCPVNKNNVPYPDVEVPGFGKVPFPEGPYTPNNSATREKQFTQKFKSDGSPVSGGITTRE
jgi:hypothetical protein